MRDKLLIAAFVAACLFAGYWAWYLVDVHYDAVYEIEGGACGPEGGCQAVLQSDDAELFETDGPGTGVPVSVPAVPMYLMLAVLGVLAWRGRLDRGRVSAIATLCGLAGLAYGGWLLFNMLYYIDSVCRFCLVMDGANLAVLALALALHPDGPIASLKAIPGLARALRTPGPEMALLPIVLVGSVVVHAATVREPPARERTELTTPAPTGPTATPAPTPGAAAQPTPRPAAAGAPAPGTKRLVLQAERAELTLDDSVPFRGPADAPVTIVVFEDFQCPYCKKLSGNVEVLLEDPEIASKVRVGFMHYPMHQSCNANELSRSLHKFACGAAAASVCAQEQGRFWEMHDLMFRNNGRLRSGNLRDYASDVGLDMDAWITCVRAASTKEKILADTRIGGAAGVTGTPALFVNGRKLVGAQPVESLRAAVEVELEGRDGRVLLDVEMEGEVVGELQGAATTVTLNGPDGPFTIDAFEASREGGRAVSAPGVTPANTVTWYDAKAACEAVGKRLCTEAEWLTACTGAVPIDEDGDGNFSRDLLQGREHAYGQHYREGWCVDSRRSDDPRPLITGNHPKCSTPTGVYDLDGNVKEWVGLTPDQAALKGGSFKSGASARCHYFKDSEAPETRDDTIGFRCCSGGDPDAAATSDEFPGGKVGDVVRDFSGALADGSGTYGTEQLRGSPFIMTFWATWCEPCKKELPALAEAYRQNKDAGLKVVGINVDSDPGKTAAFLQNTPLPFPVILDSDKAIMDTFQSRNGGVPLAFWVKADGTIRQRTVGYDDAAHSQFLESVRELME